MINHDADYGISDEVYQEIRTQEMHVMTSNPQDAFRLLGMDDGDIAMLFIEILEGPPKLLQTRLTEALEDVRERYCHALVDRELGLD